MVFTTGMCLLNVKYPPAMVLGSRWVDPRRKRCTVWRCPAKPVSPRRQKDVKPTRSNRHYCSDNAVGFPDHFPRGSYKLSGVARLGGSICRHWESSEWNRYSTGLERPPVGPHSPSSELRVFRWWRPTCPASETRTKLVSARRPSVRPLARFWTAANWRSCCYRDTVYDSSSFISSMALVDCCGTNSLLRSSSDGAGPAASSDKLAWAWKKKE